VLRHSRKFHPNFAPAFGVALCETEDVAFDFSLGSAMDQTQSLSNFNGQGKREQSAVRANIHSLGVTIDGFLVFGAYVNV